MARRSTRLSSRNSSTPKRVSLSHDASAKTPKTAPVKLGALDENEEMPGAFPKSASPPERGTPSAAPKQGMKVPVKFDESTPKHATPLKPSTNEMHPAQHHQSTAKPLDEARWLGFANMAAQTEPPKQSSRIATLQGTPTRAPKDQSSVTAPLYQFTFQREHSLELSPEAKKLMFEKREEAARIREQMTAAGEGHEDIEAAVARKIATPKGKSGRYSQAHLDQFKKMESIAGHASAFRANPAWKKPSSAQHEAQPQTPQSTSKSLKRSPSKAQLDESDRAGAPSVSRSPSKPTFAAGGSNLPRSTSKTGLSRQVDEESSSPAKRVKRFQGDDATITRPNSSGSDARQPGTPSPVKQQPSYPDLKTLASPTQASLARAASVKSMKSSKIPGRALTHSPSKPNLTEEKGGSAGPSTPLLARSPSKHGVQSHVKTGEANTQSPSKTASPLLGRSPVKGSLFKKQDGDAQIKDAPKDASLLSRSPMKMSVNKFEDPYGASNTESKQPNKDPLLSRSPMKMSVSMGYEADSEADQRKEQRSSKAPLFSRSPMKMSVTKLPEIVTSQPAEAPVGARIEAQTETAKQFASKTDTQATGTPTKSSNKSLMDRFTFLRTSPMKSILRSPQRLYSDDPAKVAAGTHLATPPKKTATEMNKKLAAAVKTVPNRKHVDFTSSTKDRYERAQSEVTSTPSKENTPASTSDMINRVAPQTAGPQYPSLPTLDAEPSITPQKRRQTITPGDFTFRAGPDGIVFGTSPNAPASMAGKRRPSTIRHVSAEPTLPPVSTTKKRKFEFENDKVTHEDNSVPAPTTTSKKRKFEFENEQVAEGEGVGVNSDKENGGDRSEETEERPAKRVKASEPSPEKKMTKRPTLGVRPKGDVKGTRATSGSGNAKGANGAVKSSGGSAKEGQKKPATISQARLAALAQPKRRG